MNFRNHLRKCWDFIFHTSDHFCASKLKILFVISRRSFLFCIPKEKINIFIHFGF